MKRQFPSKIRSKLSGGRGLLTSIILQAVQDATGRRKKTKENALAYFDSELYKIHLQLLGLPLDLQPKILQEQTDYGMD